MKSVNFVFNFILSKIMIFIVLVLFFSQALFAQKANISFEKNEIFIGEQIVFSISLQIPSNAKLISFPEIGNDSLTNFIDVIEDLSFDTALISSDLVEFNKKFLISSFDSGKHVLPVLEFLYLIENDTISFNFLSEDAVLTVNLLDADINSDIKDIKTAWALPFYWKQFIPHILIGLAILLVAFALFYYFMLRRKGVPLFPKKEIVVLPPHIEAINKLNILKEQKIWRSGQTKEYYTQLTDTLRYYIERRFDIQAPEYTSIETLEELKKFNIDEKSFKDLSHILNLADLVKFAKSSPLVTENENCLGLSYLFVENTKQEIEESEKSDVKQSNNKEQ